jgi:hypothetical protein
MSTASGSIALDLTRFRQEVTRDVAEAVTKVLLPALAAIDSRVDRAVNADTNFDTRVQERGTPTALQNAMASEMYSVREMLVSALDYDSASNFDLPELVSHLIEERNSYRRAERHLQREREESQAAAEQSAMVSVAVDNGGLVASLADRYEVLASFLTGIFFTSPEDARATAACLNERLDVAGYVLLHRSQVRGVEDLREEVEAEMAEQEGYLKINPGFTTHNLDGTSTVHHLDGTSTTVQTPTESPDNDPDMLRPKRERPLGSF